MHYFRLDRSGVFIAVLISCASTITAHKLHAAEVMLNGQSCNEACQSWMGVDKKTDSTGSIGHVSIKPALAKKRHPAEAKGSDKSRPKSEIVRSAHPHAPKLTLEPEPLALTTTKPVQPAVRQARTSVPQPPSRPEHLEGTEVRVVELPQTSAPTPAPKATFPKTTDPSELGRTASASIPPPASTDPATSTVSPVLRDAIKPLAPERAVPDNEPVETDVAKSSQVMQQPAQQRDETTRPAANAEVDGLKAAPQPSDALLASLPTFVPTSTSNQGGSVSSDAKFEQGTTTSEGKAPALPTASAEGVLSVKLGQIASDPRGTDVHVVVINNLQRPAKNVKVECEARDSQGLKIAKSVTNFSGIERSDVAFGQVLFPSQIQPANSHFACVAEEVVATLDQSRP